MNTKFNLKELIESGLINNNRFMRVTGIDYDDEDPYWVIVYPENIDCLYFKPKPAIANTDHRIRSIIAGDMMNINTYVKYNRCQVVEIRTDTFKDKGRIHPVIDIFIDVTKMFMINTLFTSNEES